MTMEKPDEGPREIFSSLCILGILSPLSWEKRMKEMLSSFLKQYYCAEGHFSFFADRSLLPPDVDDTAWGLISLTECENIDSIQGYATASKILNNVNGEGIIDTFFSKGHLLKNTLDPVVCATALYAIGLYDLLSAANSTEDYLYETLVQEEYRDGTRYYPSAESFLFMTARLVSRFTKLQDRFMQILKEKVLKRKGMAATPIELAQRVISLRCMDLPATEEIMQLISMQSENGSWPLNPFFTQRKNTIYYGSRELTTALAIKALELSSSDSEIRARR